jgi:predicted PurR-regulated permease PerM
MEQETIKKYIFWAVVVGLVILSYLIINPYIIPLITAFILAYLVKPLYDKLTPKVHKNIAAIVCIALVTIIIILPLALLAGALANQTTRILSPSQVKPILETVLSLPILQNININVPELTQRFTSWSFSIISDTVSRIPSFAVSLVIIFFGMFYTLVSWDYLSENLKKFIPFKHKEKVAKEISTTTNALVYGSIFIATLEFAFGALGFYISGVKSFLILPAIIFFLAFIPGLGPLVVWIPLAAYPFWPGHIYTALGVVITGLIISMFLDGVFRAKVLGDRAKLNPLLMFIGILGGISLFGVFGFIIGPLILVYTIKLLEQALQQK